MYDPYHPLNHNVEYKNQLMVQYLHLIILVNVTDKVDDVLEYSNHQLKLHQLLVWLLYIYIVLL